MRAMLVPLAVLAVVLPARSADDLDAKLRENAPQIIDYIQKRQPKCESVGVLGFLVDRGDGKRSTHAGELNAGLANRLEVALVLALPDDSIGIIQQATEAATKVPGANAANEKGRQRCFRGEYKVAWGDPQRQVPADLFLTGVAALSPDLKTITVRIQAFGKDGKLSEPICEFTAKTSVRTLADAGHSYLLTPKSHPKLFEGARGFDEDQLAKPAVDVSKLFQTSTGGAASNDVAPPPIDTEGPIRVTVYYNDKPVEVKNGKAPEPGANDKVWFELENRSDAVHGVVLKVNGENTLFRERLDDRECYKWILKPGDKVQVRGFQTNANERGDFTVVPPETEAAEASHYGAFLGLFHIAAFRGKLVDKDDPPQPVENPDKQMLGAIARGTTAIGRIQPGSLAALQSDLRGREKNPEGAKGIVDGDSGNPKPHPVEKVIFKADPPIPVMLYQIRYFQPKGAK